MRILNFLFYLLFAQGTIIPKFNQGQKLHFPSEILVEILIVSRNYAACRLTCKSFHRLMDPSWQMICKYFEQIEFENDLIICEKGDDQIRNAVSLLNLRKLYFRYMAVDLDLIQDCLCFTQLEDIDAENSILNEQKCKRLGSILKRHPGNLKHLKIGCCMIELEGAKHILNGLIGNKVLRKLTIRFNLFPISAFKQYIDSIKLNPMLSIDYSGCLEIE